MPSGLKVSVNISYGVMNPPQRTDLNIILVKEVVEAVFKNKGGHTNN